MKTLLVLASLVALLGAKQVYASDLDASESHELLTDHFEKVKQLCPEVSSIFSCTQVKMTHLKQMHPRLEKLLKQIANESTRMWADSVLEGPYETRFNDLRLDRVDEVRDSSNHLIALRVQFSFEAWYTGRCAYDMTKPATLESCAAGRLNQIIYASPDLLDAVVSEEAFPNPYFTPASK